MALFIESLQFWRQNSSRFVGRDDDKLQTEMHAIDRQQSGLCLILRKCQQHYLTPVAAASLLAGLDEESIARTEPRNYMWQGEAFSRPTLLCNMGLQRNLCRLYLVTPVHMLLS